MGWIIFTVIMAILAIMCLAGIGPLIQAMAEPEPVGPFGFIIAAGVTAVLVGFWVLMTVTRMYHSVPAGNEGLVYGIGGNIVGQRGEGVAWTAPWQGFRTANVQVQTLAFIDDENHVPEGAKRVSEGLDSFSSETQNVYMDVILRIRVSPENVQELYTEVGPNYVNKLIPGSVAQIFKDETINFRAVEIAPERETIRAAVEQHLRAELAQFSISVDAVLIENITFDQAFEDSITQKQVATQDALRAQEQVAQREAEARGVAAAAQGRSDALRIEAQGQADANRLISASLTPQLIQFQAVQKLTDNVQIALIPSGQGIIIDPATLLTPAQ